MESERFEPLLDGLTFPEAPRWHEGRLWFSDFYSFRVMTVDSDGRAEVIAHVPQRPSGLGWTPDGALLVVSMLDHKLLRLDGSALTEVADLSPFAGGPCNDMVVDAQGRAGPGTPGRNSMITPRSGTAPMFSTLWITGGLKPARSTAVSNSSTGLPSGHCRSFAALSWMTTRWLWL